MWIQWANPNQSQDYSNLTFIYPSAFRSAFSLFSLCICFDRGPVLLLWQNPTQSPDLAQSTKSIRHFHSAELLVLFSPRTGYPMGWVTQWWKLQRERALEQGSYGCGPSWRHIPCLGHIPSVPSDLTHHPQLLRSHMDLQGWSGERKRSDTALHTVSPLFLPSIHPCPVPKELFWKGSSSQQLNPIHVRHEMPQAALRD